MNRSLLYRGLLILAVVALAAASAWPLQEKINLGLDLRGGMHLVLEVQTEDAVEAELDRAAEILRDQAIEEELTGVQVRRGEDDELIVTGVPPEGDEAIGRIRTNQLGEQSWDWDRRGDTIVFEPSAGFLAETRDMAVRQAQQTITNRVDAYGVAEPVIQQLGDSNRIVVQLPGVDDPERIRELIKNTAFLEFRRTEYPPGGGSVATREEIVDHYNGAVPEDVEILESDQLDAEGRKIGTQYVAVGRASVVTGRDLKNARPDVGQFGESVVGFSLTPEAGQRFGDFTGANVGRGLAIVLDDKVVSAPVIEDRIGDRGIIRGNFTQQEVEDLSLVLRSGALPAGIVYLEERTVGPSLGRDSIQQGLRAGAIGFGLVILLMLLVYKRSGINAVTALALNVVLIFGALAYFGATLTLPGIAGIILTIGMAVDANVLVFERIKEELRAGRTVKSAIESGFAKALSSILDANVTTLIAALFLFQFGTGPIRGFAVTLSVGIFASVFTAVFVSRWIFDLLLSRRQRVERLSI
ncbi:MAG TPA: protein translocase subunit SecD [Thermoanaerobaculia bacterium]|nr:protein translocase subunit SecD [Thermoanaerobaculia bacterium]